MDVYIDRLRGYAAYYVCLHAKVAHKCVIAMFKLDPYHDNDDYIMYAEVLG